MRRLLLAAVLLLPSPGNSQQSVMEARGAVLRGLDKISGALVDMEIPDGESRRLGRIEVSVEDCRFPAENPSSDAFAHVTVRSDGVPDPIFSGWMIASSPGLSALDHPRYDVWVLRCMTS